MIRTVMGATAALALLVSSGAFAATTATPSTTAPAAQNSTAQPAQGQFSSIGQPQLKAKVAAHQKYRDVVGNRETAALNSLEASGYFSVKDMHPDGKNISVEAKKPGADFVRLTVQPDGTINPAA
jgi:hypothetical protein